LFEDHSEPYTSILIVGEDSNRYQGDGISAEVGITMKAPDGIDLNRWAIYRSICEKYGRQKGWTDEQLFSLPDSPGSLNAGIYWLVSGMSGWDGLELSPEDVLVGGVLRFERQRLKV
jgi:hypothetical protein